MRTAIVILNWNGEKLLEKYLPGVVDSAALCPDVRVVVADNASTDGSVALLKERFPSVEVRSLRSNYGFAKGYNMALKKLDDDVFILLNSDVEVKDGWIEPLTEWMSLHPECGVCGPKLHRIDEPDCFEYAGAAGGFIDSYGYPFCRGRVLDLLEKDEGQYDTPGEIFWASGAAMAVRRDVFAALGGFREEFFMHMEEIDFCWRARLAGWRVNIVPRSTVWHLGAGTLSQNSPAKAYYNHRNNLLMLHADMPLTIALFAGMETLAEASDQNEGPDFFGNCFDTFNDPDLALDGKLPDSMARFGTNAAKFILAVRYLMDFATAALYLIQGKGRCFLAVFRAHRDFRRMRGKMDRSGMAKRLQKAFAGRDRAVVETILGYEPEELVNEGGENVYIKCMLGKWIVWQRYFKKGSIFALIRDNFV